MSTKYYENTTWKRRTTIWTILSKHHDGSRWWNQEWMTTGVPSWQLYKGLQYLSNHNLSKCKIHPILKHRCYSSLEISRIPVKLRLVTGTYVLQTKRIKYYRNETDPTCLLCGAAEENVLHFILQCEKLVGESSFTVRDQRYMAKWVPK